MPCEIDNIDVARAVANKRRSLLRRMHLLQVYGRFASAQWRQRIAHFLQEAANSARIVPCIIAQSPADRLADKEIAFRRQSARIAEQALDVGVAAPAELVDHRDAAQP